MVAQRGEDDRVSDPVQGARNLLSACAGVRSGDYVLLIGEPLELGVYDDGLAPFIASETERLGARAEIIRPELAEGPESVSGDLFDRIAATDHTIFLSRIGDMLRFNPLPGGGSKTMCYALNLELLGSAFGTLPYPFLFEVRRRLVGRLAAARSYTIRSPLGTDLSMTLPEESRYGQNDDFTVKNFPWMIVPPISASALNGRMVLSNALTSTSIHLYDDAVIPLRDTVVFDVEMGRITGIAGHGKAGYGELAARIRAQFARVADLFGGEALIVNSWHAGINSETFFSCSALSDLDRWSAISFGSPRYLHFHMCGHAPGDICGQMFDCEIAFDDVPIWQGGRLVFLDLPENRDLLEAFPGIELPALPHDIGIG